MKRSKKLNRQYEDELSQTLLEKDKEYALILDAKLIEHEDQILDTENRLHREYIEKISKFQEIIKDIKLENEALYEENSLKQRQLDDNMNTINQLKECLKSMQTKNVVHPRENSMNFRETN